MQGTDITCEKNVQGPDITSERNVQGTDIKCEINVKEKIEQDMYIRVVIDCLNIWVSSMAINLDVMRVRLAQTAKGETRYYRA